MNPRQILRIKQWLAQNGYDVGKMDGVAGARFVKAWNSALDTTAFKRFLRAQGVAAAPLSNEGQPQTPGPPAGTAGESRPGARGGGGQGQGGGGGGGGNPPASVRDQDPSTPGVQTGPRPGGAAPPSTPGEEDPGTPDDDELSGYEYIGLTPDGRQEIWRHPETGDVQYRTTSQASGELRAELQSVLDQFGLNTPGSVELIEQAVREDWTPLKFLQKLRQSDDYMNNPLFRANVERGKEGGDVWTEAQVLHYASEVRRLARRYGFQVPSDNFIGDGIRSNKSLSELEHLIQIERNVQDFGGGVRFVFEEELGVDVNDQFLRELFDPDVDTSDWERAYKNALYRGRPFVFGLGIRSQREADALMMMGVTPEEADRRYQSVAANADLFEKLASIESVITDKLPMDFGEFIKGVDNGLLVQAEVFQNPRARAEIQAMWIREVARFAQGGGPATTSSGAAAGLLAPGER